MIFRNVKIKTYERLRLLIIKLLPEINLLSKQNGNDYNLKSSISNSIIGKKVKLYPIYHINDSNIGDFTYIAQNSYVSKTTIGKFCSIGPNLICGWGIHPIHGISTSPMFYSTAKQNGFSLSEFDKIEERKEIMIGNDVFIGANVTILDGVSIGDGAVIGAGAVVSKDIPPYSISVGCPIRVIRYRFEEDVIKQMLLIKWWDWDESKLHQIEEHFFNVQSFIKKYC